MAIKGMVGARGKLYVRTDSGLHTLKNNGKEPRDWDKAQFSSTPADSPFMDFFFDELQNLVNTSTIFDQDRQELLDAIMIMATEGFLPAYEDLRAIRAYKGHHIPVLNRKKHYEDFARSLWHGYKDLMPKVVGLLGYDTGFVFQRDGKFKAGLEAFVADNHGDLLLNVAEFLPRQRNGWQEELKTFRNGYLEHRDADVAAQVERFYEPVWAEKVFLHAWRTAAELIVFLLETRFPAMLSVTHRAAERQFSSTRPFLYEVYMCDPKQVQRRSFTKIVRP
jgi:hypothetical protein